MITRFHIENFKSLLDFDLPEKPLTLRNFVCLVGMNGSGKTNVLQALDFLAQLMAGRIGEWLERRGWEGFALASYQTEPMGNSGRWLKKSPGRVISFEIELEFSPSLKVCWQGSFNRVEGRCTYEKVSVAGVAQPVLEHTDRHLRVRSAATGKDIRSENTADIEFGGSVLSRYHFLEPALFRLKSVMLMLKSLELLTPSAMRRRSRQGADIGYGGEELSAFIDGLQNSARDELQKTLVGFYPHLKKLGMSTTRGGWKKLLVTEFFKGPITTNASHVNDGMLRVIAIVAQAYSKHPILLFDEIENGINPELVEKLVDFLVGMKKQVIVTTHSPMILNYLEDKIARESVFLLYRDESGWTRSVRFFDLPETSVKLESLGPGEVFVDTNLTRLTKRLAPVSATKSNGKS